MAKKVKAPPVLPPANYSPLIVTGLDISLTNTGSVGLVDGREPKTRSIKPNSNMRGLERLAWIEGEVDRLFFGLAPSHVLAVIEGYSMGLKLGSVLADLAEIGGIIRLALWRRRVPMLIVPPSSLKFFITGKGNSTKDVMLKEVYRRWGFDTNDNNLADAYALAKVGEAWLGRADKLTEYQRRALAGVTEFIAGGAQVGQAG